MMRNFFLLGLLALFALNYPPNAQTVASTVCVGPDCPEVEVSEVPSKEVSAPVEQMEVEAESEAVYLGNAKSATHYYESNVDSGGYKGACYGGPVRNLRAKRLARIESYNGPRNRTVGRRLCRMNCRY